MGKVITGWVGKNEWKEFLRRPEFDDLFMADNLPTIYKERKDQWYWGEDDWPPVKVTVTVQEVKKESES